MKKLTLYHGSPNTFETFVIDEKWVRTPIQQLAEGMGIYLTEEKAFAREYGDYVYTVELSESDVSDFTDRAYVKDLLSTISEQVHVPIHDWLNFDLFFASVACGNISVTMLYNEIEKHLDNKEAFHEHYGHLLTYEEDCLFEKIKQVFLKETKDVCKYFDPGFKRPIYICVKRPEKLVITRCEHVNEEKN